MEMRIVIFQLHNFISHLLKLVRIHAMKYIAILLLTLSLHLCSFELNSIMQDANFPTITHEMIEDLDSAQTNDFHEEPSFIELSKCHNCFYKTPSCYSLNFVLLELTPYKKIKPPRLHS